MKTIIALAAFVNAAAPGTEEAAQPYVDNAVKAYEWVLDTHAKNVELAGEIFIFEDETNGEN